jgi:hypothetical protein
MKISLNERGVMTTLEIGRIQNRKLQPSNPTRKPINVPLSFESQPEI